MWQHWQNSEIRGLLTIRGAEDVQRHRSFSTSGGYVERARLRSRAKTGGRQVEGAEQAVSRHQIENAIARVDWPFSERMWAWTTHK